MRKLSEGKSKSEKETIISEVVVGDNGLESSMVGRIIGLESPVRYEVER